MNKNEGFCHFSESEQRRFDELTKRSYKKVYDLAYRLAGNRQDAEDLTQEAFYRAYRAFANYQGDRPFENWILRIVSRLLLDHLRKRRRHVITLSLDAPRVHQVTGDDLYGDVADESPNPEQTILAGTYSEELSQVLKSLSAEQKLLVTLADIERLPYQEIADIIGTPIGTVRSRVHRTHKLIRDRLERTSPSRQSAPARPLGRSLPGAVSFLLVVVLGATPFIGMTAQAKPVKKKETPVSLTAKVRALFVNRCAACHGSSAQGGEGPNLHGLRLSDTAITAIVTNGVANEMPAFKSSLKGLEIKSIISYLRTLKK